MNDAVIASKIEGLSERIEETNARLANIERALAFIALRGAPRHLTFAERDALEARLEGWPNRTTYWRGDVR